MNDEQLLIQLRDCFTAGYTLPQFCIDNGLNFPPSGGSSSICRYVSRLRYKRALRQDDCKLSSTNA